MKSLNPPSAILAQLEYSFSIYSWPEVAGDVTSGEDVKDIGIDVQVKFGDSRSNHSRIMRPSHFMADKYREYGPYR